MRRLLSISLCCSLGVAASAVSRQQPEALTMYFVDVEGGQSTLIITPDGQSLLVDAGYSSRRSDPGHIVEAMNAAGVTRIDRMIVTHFHPDHVGGIPELAERVSIGMVFDHGDTAEPDDQEMQTAVDGYRSVRPRLHPSEPHVGEELHLGDVALTWVSSNRHTLGGHVRGGGGRNPACASYIPEAEDELENTRSVGFLLEYDRFRFLDVGDLTGAPLAALVCPVRRIGPIDLYLLPHHGEEDGTYPAALAGFRPRAIVIDNGARKGARRGALDLVHRWEPPIGVWQLHRAIAPDVENFSDAVIANLDTTTSFPIKAVAWQDGSFSITNGRTGETTHFDRRDAAH